MNLSSLLVSSRDLFGREDFLVPSYNLESIKDHAIQCVTQVIAPSPEGRGRKYTSGEGDVDNLIFSLFPV